MSQSRYQELCKSLETAREAYAGYRSECVWFAAQLARGLIEYAGWPRELVTMEAVAGESAGLPTEKPEDAMHLDEDAFWHFGLRLALEVPKGRDSLLLRVRFKKLEKRHIVSLFGFEDFEVAEPTVDAMQPIFETILNAVKRHYDFGLRQFLENGGRGLKVPVSPKRLQEMAKGAGGAA